MSYQYPSWEPEPRTPRWALVVAAVIVFAGFVAACVIYFSDESGEPIAAEPRAATADAQAAPRVDQTPERRQTNAPAPANAERKERPSGGSGFLDADAEASFASLSASLSGQVGLVVLPLGGGAPRQFGELAGGHAWSTIKVPILTTLLREQGESLDPEEEAWARGAITASDNEDAAALFGRLEDLNGGLEGASQAVDAVLRAAGDTTTVVATAPPPPGAVSTYGQTEWSLLDSARFFAALGRCELLGPSASGYVMSLMEEVISEQRWGLGEASFPPGATVGMKGGWGPESNSGGAYLVRQSGLIRNGDRGLAVAMAAIDDSGTYPGGAADLTAMAGWLAEELRGLGPRGGGCAG